MRPKPISTNSNGKHLTFYEALYAHCFNLGITLTAPENALTIPPRSVPTTAEPLRALIQDYTEERPPARKLNDEIWQEIAPHLAKHDILFTTDLCDPGTTKLRT